MNRFILCLFALPAVAFAQSARIPANSTAYIEPVTLEPGRGFENYLLAAFQKVRVPLTVVTERSGAGYLIRSTVNASAYTGSRGYSTSLVSVSILIVDPKSSPVFSYATGSYDVSEMKYVAEECAKHIKKFTEKPKK